MIIRNLKECSQTDRRIVTKTWESTRLLLKDDEMGFSFHITTIYPETETRMWYQHHLESVYCIDGEGDIISLDEGTTRTIRPGTMYALDKHDRHVLRAKSKLTLACVFNPPLNGTEVHDSDGTYPLDAPGVTGR
jgi:L-ectoine synthase